MSVQGDGDCFAVAADWMWQNRNLVDDRGSDALVLVHAEVQGQGPLEGERFMHAWVEYRGIAIDKSNGRDIGLPTELYRAVAKLSDERRYSLREMARMMVLTGHYGPWDEEHLCQNSTLPSYGANAETEEA